MTSKKPSGAESRRRRAFRRACEQAPLPLRGILRPSKRGHPQGSTKVPNLIVRLKRDLAWIGEPEWTSSRLATKLQKQKFYKQIPRRTLRGHIEAVQNWMWKNASRGE